MFRILTIISAHTLNKTRKPTATAKAKVARFRSLPLPPLRQQFAMHLHLCPQQRQTRDERHKLVSTQQPVQVHHQFRVHPTVLFNLLLLPPPTTGSLNPDR